MRAPSTFEKKIKRFLLLLFRLFLSEILSRGSRLSRTTSDPALKTKSARNFRPKVRLSVFPAKILSRFCHTFLDFREQQAFLAKVEVKGGLVLAGEGRTANLLVLEFGGDRKTTQVSSACKERSFARVSASFAYFYH